jgi:hypothetical protein
MQVDQAAFCLGERTDGAAQFAEVCMAVARLDTL